MAVFATIARPAPATGLPVSEITGISVLRTVGTVAWTVRAILGRTIVPVGLTRQACGRCNDPSTAKRPTLRISQSVEPPPS